MSKKKPAKPAKKTAKAASRKPQRSQGELGSEDLDSVAGGIIIVNSAPTPEYKRTQTLSPTVDASLSIKSIKQMLP